MEVTKLPLSFFVDRLNANEPFTFVRHGDGEFQCIVGLQGHNCDGQEYTNDLQDALKKTLKEPRDYIYAIGPKIIKRDNYVSKHALSWIERHAPSIKWYDSETLLNASVAGELFPFTEALQKHRVMLVGPTCLTTFGNDLFGIDSSIVYVPNKNSWEVAGNTAKLVLRDAYQVDVILFSAGMATKPLIWNLFPHLGETHFLLDCGSLWDMYAGVKSRSYARKMSDEEIERLRQLNFGK